MGQITTIKHYLRKLGHRLATMKLYLRKVRHTVQRVYFTGEKFRKFRGSVNLCENIIREYITRAPCPLVLACSDSGGVADIMGICENFIRKINKCQISVKIFSREINPQYCRLATIKISLRKLSNKLASINFNLKELRNKLALSCLN